VLFQPINQGFLAEVDFALQALRRGRAVRGKVLSRLRNLKSGLTAASIHHQADCSSRSCLLRTDFGKHRSSSGSFAMFARDARRFFAPGQSRPPS
jgi:hypothetical protein